MIRVADILQLAMERRRDGVASRSAWRCCPRVHQRRDSLAPRSNTTGQVIFLGLQEPTSTDNVVVAGRKWITREAIDNSATHVVPKGAILLVTRTGVGKVAIAGADIAISQDLTGIVLKEGTNADFVVAAIRQKTRNLLDIQQGAIIKGVLRKDVEKLEIPLPPLSEQHRIVEILDQAELPPPPSRRSRRQGRAYLACALYQDVR